MENSKYPENGTFINMLENYKKSELKKFLSFFEYVTIHEKADELCIISDFVYSRDYPDAKN